MTVERHLLNGGILSLRDEVHVLRERFGFQASKENGPG